MALKIHKLQNTTKNAKENQIKCCDRIGAGRVSVGGHICAGLCWMSGIQQRKLLKVSTKTWHETYCRERFQKRRGFPGRNMEFMGEQGEERSVV